MDYEDWKVANDAARAREWRQAHIQYLLTLATMLHRGMDYTMRPDEYAPHGRFGYRIDVDDPGFWKVWGELRERLGWK